MRSFVFVLTQALHKIGMWVEKVGQMPCAYTIDT